MFTHFGSLIPGPEMAAGAALWIVLFGNSSIPNGIGHGPRNFPCILQVFVLTRMNLFIIISGPPMVSCWHLGPGMVRAILDGALLWP